MISLGIDVGSLTTKLVLMEDKRLTFCDIVSTGIDIADSITNLLNRTLGSAGLCINEIDRIVATGIGKGFVPYPVKTVTEAKSDATGTRFYYHAAEGVIDIGAENSRIIKFNSAGKILDMASNDKCAAGTGLFFDTMAKALGMESGEREQFHSGKNTARITSTCVVLAESEVVSMIHQKGGNRFEIWKGICDSVAARIYSMFAKLCISGQVVIIGGVARNPDFIGSMDNLLGRSLLVPSNPQIIGALGAALLGQDQMG